MQFKPGKRRREYREERGEPGHREGKRLPSPARRRFQTEDSQNREICLKLRLGEEVE